MFVHWPFAPQNNYFNQQKTIEFVGASKKNTRRQIITGLAETIELQGRCIKM
jgi:hypothetical protein